MTEAIYIETHIAVNERRISVSGVLRYLGVSRSGYHRWLNSVPSQQEQRKEAVIRRVKEFYEESYQNYGAPKITVILNKENVVISQRTVGQYMREVGIQAQYIKPWIKTTKDCDYSNKLKNVLDRDFSPDSPNACWCTDITYIWTYDDGFVYLTSIMDFYSRKIISWTLSKTMEVDEVLKCLEIAKQRRKTENPIVIQSDRGVQFVSKKYQSLTDDMIRSYSHKGNPWDNACIESFHALIKREKLKRYKIQNYTHAYQLIFEYIETFYNTVRIHSHCDYLSPNQYEIAYEQFKIQN